MGLATHEKEQRIYNRFVNIVRQRALFQNVFAPAKASDSCQGEQMKNLFRIVVAVSALVLGGCAVNSGVHPASDPSAFSGAAYAGQTTKVNDPITAEQYRLFNQAAVGQVSTDTILTTTEKQAIQFCEKKAKKYRVLSETVSTPPHILGNFHRAEILFECV